MKKILLLPAFLVTMVSSSVFAGGDDPTNPIAPGDKGDGGGSTCTVTSNCIDIFGTVEGTVSCTGTVCMRGSGWVECNGKKTSC